MLNEISEILKQPVPFSSILDKKIPLPSFLEANIQLSIPKERLTEYWKSLSEPLQQKGKKESEQKRAPTTFSFEGEIKKGLETPFSLDGIDLVISPDAWIFGDIQLGVRARASGIVRRNGTHIVTKIAVQ